MQFLKNIHLLIAVMLFFSCSKSLDFEQIEDYSLKPNFTVPLFFFNVEPVGLSRTSSTSLVTEITKEVDFKLFENSFLKENLIKLDFNFEAKNLFSIGFDIEISLLDENDAVVYKMQNLKIEANKLDFTQKESIDVLLNKEIKNFTKVTLKLKRDSTTPINSSRAGSLVFKSSTIIFLDASL